MVSSYFLRNGSKTIQSKERNRKWCTQFRLLHTNPIILRCCCSVKCGANEYAKCHRTQGTGVAGKELLTRVHQTSLPLKYGMHKRAHGTKSLIKYQIYTKCTISQWHFSMARYQIECFTEKLCKQRKWAYIV